MIWQQVPDRSRPAGLKRSEWFEAERAPISDPRDPSWPTDMPAVAEFQKLASALHLRHLFLRPIPSASSGTNEYVDGTFFTYRWGDDVVTNT